MGAVSKCKGVIRLTTVTFQDGVGWRTVNPYFTPNPILPARSFCNASALPIRYEVEYVMVNGVKFNPKSGVNHVSYRTQRGTPVQVYVQWWGRQPLTLKLFRTSLTTTG